MSEQYPIDYEAITADQLTEACLDLHAAMRRQQQRSLSHDRAKARLVLERQGILTGNTPAQQRQIIESQSTRPDVMRRRIRQAFMVPIGTQLTGEGHSIAHFWSVYEAEESAQQKQPPTIHLVADEVSQRAATGTPQSNRLYDIFINAGTVYVFRAGQMLSTDHYDEPTNIVQAARELYT